VSEARLAVVETHVEYLREAVDEIRATQLEIRDAQIIGAAADKARKSTVVRIASVTGTAMGLVGSVVGWAVSHGKLPLAIAAYGVLLYSAPAVAQRVQQPDDPMAFRWYAEIKVCSRGRCHTVNRLQDGAAACEVATRALHERVPLMRPQTPFTVDTRCLMDRSDLLPS
jgi:uncharacterized membrane protein